MSPPVSFFLEKRTEDPVSPKRVRAVHSHGTQEETLIDSRAGIGQALKS